MLPKFLDDLTIRNIVIAMRGSICGCGGSSDVTTAVLKREGDVVVTITNDRLVAIDLGGTQSFRDCTGGGRKVVGLGEPVTLKSGDYDGIPAAWADFERRCGVALPNRARFRCRAGRRWGGQATNLPWRIEREALKRELGSRRCG